MLVDSCVGVLDYLAAPQTWVECNLLAPAQPPSHPTVKLSDAMKVTRKVTYEANKAAAMLLDADIQTLHQLQEDEIKKIVKTCIKKVSEIEAILNHCVNYKNTRLLNMAIALTHMQSKKMNEGT